MTKQESYFYGCAFKAMEAATTAMNQVPEIYEASFDNDNDSGEIIFSVQGDEKYYFVLTLKRAKED